MAEKPSQRNLPLHANASFMAQSGRVLVFNSARTITRRSVIQLGRRAETPYRGLRRGVQQNCRAVRVDQVKSLPAPHQSAPSQRLVIPGTSDTSDIDTLTLDNIDRVASPAMT